MKDTNHTLTGKIAVITVVVRALGLLQPNYLQQKALMFL
jgi:hypothetical protein